MQGSISLTAIAKVMLFQSCRSRGATSNWRAGKPQAEIDLWKTEIELSPESLCPGPDFAARLAKGNGYSNL